MKLFIQIPCFNEVGTLASVIENLPKEIDGISSIETLIVDDASDDGTAVLARKLGITHIIRTSSVNRRWLGRAFRCGVDYALKKQADIVLNIDADNQYQPEYIPKLLAPILSGKADISIGNRNPHKVKYFSKNKRLLQLVGNKIISFVSGHKIPDALSGFRAYSRESLLVLTPIVNYSYTIDTLIQACCRGLVVEFVSVQVNGPTRPSRLITNNFTKCIRSAGILIGVMSVFAPLRLYLLLASVCSIAGITCLLYGKFTHCLVLISGCASLKILGFSLIGVAIFFAIYGIIAKIFSLRSAVYYETLRRIREIEIMMHLDKK